MPISRALRFAFLCSLAVSRAFAWESFPEYGSLDETEQAAFEGPVLLTSEYSSDLVTYTEPSELAYRWISAPRALHLNLGSLNTRRFLTDQKLKLNHAVSDAFEIRFTFFDNSNLERQSVHWVLDLVFWPKPWLGLALYGEPSHRKPNDDTGLAFLLRPQARHEIRLFNTWVDVTRLKYPDGANSFVEPDLPKSRGVVGRVWSDPGTSGPGEFLEYAIRYETPTRWRFTGDGYEYRYWRAFGSAHARRRIAEKLAMTARVQLDRKLESREAIGATTSELGRWFTTRLSALLEATRSGLGPHGDWDLSVGLHRFERHWTTDSGVFRHRDTLPVIRLRVPSGDRAAWNFSYLATFHDENWNPAEDGRFEQRLNLSYVFLFNPQASLTLAVSGDLDRFGSRKTWDGGSGRLRIRF